MGHINKKSYGQTVIVAKSGGNYSTISSAITGITDAAADKVYTILIYPGTYTENVVLTDYINLVGIGSRYYPVIMTSATGTTLTFPDGSDCVIKDIKIESTGGECVDLPTGSSSTCLISNCHITFTDEDVAIEGIVDVNSGTLIIENTAITYLETHNAGIAGADWHAAIVATDDCSISLFNCLGSMTVGEDDNDNIVFIEEANGKKIALTVKNCIFNIVVGAGGNWTGNVYFFKTQGDGQTDGQAEVERKFQNNHIDIACANPNGTAWIYYVDSADDSMIVHSIGNWSRVNTFDTSYIAYMATGDEFRSHWDFYEGANSYGGAGSFNYINSPYPGWFESTYEMDVASGTFHVNASASGVGINTPLPQSDLDVRGTTYLGAKSASLARGGFYDVNSYTDMWWKMEDSAANTVVSDSGANTWTGVLVGGDNTEDLTETGKIGRCLHFNGTDDYVSIGEHLLTGLTGNWRGAISLWFKRDADNDTGYALFNMSADDSALGSYLLLGMECSGNRGFYEAHCIQDSFGWAMKTTSGVTTANVGKWTHMVLTHDGSAPQMWVNNIKQTVTWPTDNDRTFWFGAITTSTVTKKPNTAVFGGIKSNGTLWNQFDGSLDDIRIINVGIDTATIAGLYNAGRGVDTGLANYSKINQIAASETFAPEHAKNTSVDTLIEGNVEVTSNIYADGNINTSGVFSVANVPGLNVGFDITGKGGAVHTFVFRGGVLTIKG